MSKNDIRPRIWFLWLSLYVLSCSLLYLACVPQGPHQILSPLKSDSEKLESGTISFEEVQPIFQRRCSRCHNGTGLKDWRQRSAAYEVARNGRLKERIVQTKSMPPLGSPEAHQMTSEEREKIHQWVVSIKASSELSGDGLAGSVGDGQGATPTPSLGPFAVLERCTACHGLFGRSQIRGYPHLAGQSPDYLHQQLRDFREGRRSDKTNMMAVVAADLTEKEQNFVVDYFGRLKNLSKALTAENSEGFDISALNQKIIKGRDLAIKYACSICHLSDLDHDPSLPGAPYLEGQDPTYLANQLKSFSEGLRSNAPIMSAIMSNLAQELTQEDFEALALYFRNFKFQELQSSKP